MERELKFVEYLTKAIYKMLVLKEQNDQGENVFLADYIENLYVEINGAYLWSNFFNTNRDFTVITSIIAYMSRNDMEYKRFRREVFKCLNILNKIESGLAR